MGNLIARHRMKSSEGKAYLVNHFEDELGNMTFELLDGSQLEHVGGFLFRISRTGEIVRDIGWECADRPSKNPELRPTGLDYPLS